MAYLGKTPSQAVRSRYYFTASGSETSLSPSEVTGLSFTDANYVDVSLNGVALVSGTDYTATPSTNTISGLAALAASDVVEIVVYDTFSVFGGSVKGDFDISNGTLTAEATTISGNLSVDGGTIKLDGNYPTGTNNVALGNQALDDGSLSGSHNTAIGNDALTANTTGASNTAVGRDTLKANLTGSNNVAVGASVLQSATGSSNTGVGAGAFAANTSGANNTAVGKDALGANTTGTENDAFGSQALDANTTGAGNVGIGRTSFTSVTTGNNNAGMGYQTGYYQTGSQNTFVGSKAGIGADGSSTANNNTGVGYLALTANTTGAENTAVGMQSLDANTTGASNTGMGVNTLTSNTTASDNTAVGRDALQNNTTGAENTAVGRSALNSNTTGTPNQAFGRQALYSNTTGNANCAFGEQALYANTTGNNNVAVGNLAGDAITTGADNTVVGKNAGGAVTTSNQNCLIGSGAGSAITTGANNTVIGGYTGNSGGLDIRTSSNNIALSDGDGSVRLRATAQGSVIIPGNGGASGDAPAGSNCSLTVYRDGSTLRVAHFHNEQNTSGAENLRAVLESNCNNSSSYYFIGTISGVGDKIYIYGNGNIQNANNSYGAFSDIKLKENISDATSQWDDIKALQVKKYSLIEDDLDAANKLGVIAQDLEASGMGGLVETLDDKDEEGLLTGTQTKAVKYSILYMKAVKALQEAMTRIETLETQRADLEARVTALENA